MPREMRHAVYNSRIAILGMLIFLLRILRAAGFVFVVVFLAHSVSAADWSAPESQLASKIAATTGPGAVALNVENRSSLSRADFEDITRGLRNQLAALGVQTVNPEQAAATVQISLSENLHSYVWVAEIHLGAGESSVVMISTPHPGAISTVREAAAVSIHKALLWSQTERILDVAVIDGNPTEMIVLDPDQVTLYRLQDNHWQQQQSLAIAHSRPWPRDLRGRLVQRQDHLFDAYLPGVLCRSSARAPLSLDCSESDDPWPLGPGQINLSAFFTPARNYFTGALSPGVGKQTTVSAFYTAAPLPREKYTLWIFAGADGKTHLLDGVTDQTAAKLEWGSDIASVQTGCGPGWDVIATGVGDGATDSLRAFELLDREPAAVSPVLGLSGGRITALWTENNQRDAIAVLHNLESGEYEAYRLSFTCGQ